MVQFDTRVALEICSLEPFLPKVELHWSSVSSHGVCLFLLPTRGNLTSQHLQGFYGLSDDVLRKLLGYVVSQNRIKQSGNSSCKTTLSHLF